MCRYLILKMAQKMKGCILLQYLSYNTIRNYAVQHLLANSSSITWPLNCNLCFVRIKYLTCIWVVVHLVSFLFFVIC